MLNCYFFFAPSPQAIFFQKGGVSFSRVYVCVKAKLTLVSFFLLFLCTFPYLCSLPNFLLEYANIFTHIYFTQVFFYTDIFLTWIRQYFYTDIPATSATFHMCLSLLMLLLMMILISMYFCFALLHVSDVWVRQMERHLVHSLFTALQQKCSDLSIFLFLEYIYTYLIFVTGATGGARENFFWPV